ncbi:hypothetical protein S83_051914, partial [Arachis hypogaea]
LKSIKYSQHRNQNDAQVTVGGNSCALEEQNSSTGSQARKGPTWESKRSSNVPTASSKLHELDTYQLGHPYCCPNDLQNLEGSELGLSQFGPIHKQQEGGLWVREGWHLGRVAKDGSDLGMLLAKRVEGNLGLEDAGRPGCSRVTKVAHDRLKATLGSGLLSEPGTGPRVDVSREVVAESRGTNRSASGAVDGDLEPGRLGTVRSVKVARTQKQRDLAGARGSNVGGENWL